jgi:anti-sigma regulatory factor (Ser/Thr protein kinase)
MHGWRQQSIPNCVTAAALCRSFVTDALTYWNRLQLVDDARLVVSELVENVVVHTTGGGELRLCLEAEELVIEVSDASPALPRVFTDVGTDRCHGRGMRLVDAIADRWGVYPNGQGGKVVWVRLARGQLPTAVAQPSDWHVMVKHSWPPTTT